MRTAFQARKDSKTMGFGGVLWVLSAAGGSRKYPVGDTWQGVRCMGYYGCPCCGAQNFRAALRRTLEILTAATRSGPPSCQPIGGRGSGRESGHFLEIASLHPPLAALRRFPRFIRHWRRSDRSPRAQSAFAMTGLARSAVCGGTHGCRPTGILCRAGPVCPAGRCGAYWETGGTEVSAPTDA